MDRKHGRCCEPPTACIDYFSVALARAVYARTKYVLLDDPLSAVVSSSFGSFL